MKTSSAPTRRMCPGKKDRTDYQRISVSHVWQMSVKIYKPASTGHATAESQTMRAQAARAHKPRQAHT